MKPRENSARFSIQSMHLSYGSENMTSVNVTLMIGNHQKCFLKQIYAVTLDHTGRATGQFSLLLTFCMCL